MVPAAAAQKADTYDRFHEMSDTTKCLFHKMSDTTKCLFRKMSDATKTTCVCFWRYDCHKGDFFKIHEKKENTPSVWNAAQEEKN